MAVAKAPPIISLTEFDESINMMVYADSGVGKTVLAGTSGGLLLGVEKGVISAKRAGSTCDLWQVNSWKDIEDAQIWLRNGGHQKYPWVALDSLTEMQEMLWRHILDKVVADNKSRDPYIPAIQDHQKMQHMMRHFVNRFCDLPCNVLFTALPMNVETEDGEERVMPLVTGQKGALSHYVVGKMSCVGHMKVVKTKSGTKMRRVTWETDGAYIGKDRYGCLAPYTDQLTIPELVAKIEESGDLNSKPVRRTAARRARRTTTTRRRASA